AALADRQGRVLHRNPMLLEFARSDIQWPGVEVEIARSLQACIATVGFDAAVIPSDGTFAHRLVRNVATQRAKYRLNAVPLDTDVPGHGAAIVVMVERDETSVF